MSNPRPMGRGRHLPIGEKSAFKKETFGRLVRLLLQRYWLQLLVVGVCIFASMAAQLQGALFLQTLIDHYILPVMALPTPDLSPLAAALWRVGCIYAVGIAASFLYNRIMILVSQGMLRELRMQLFSHMQRLPVRYFDVHPHGDTMSVYTNDVDTLREFVGRSLPQLASSAVTAAGVLVGMLMLNIPLTLLTLLMLGFSLYITKVVASKSGRFFGAQQAALGTLNGYIKEMMDGQKVIKVFCREEETVERFLVLNEELRQSARNAGRLSNMLMPLAHQMGNLSYVFCAVGGALLALNGYGGLTLGGLVSFLTLNRSFTQPMSQISQQLQSVVMAMAGAERIFLLLDEQPEPDDGTVTLVNTCEVDGVLTECPAHTGLWAWKKLTQDGSVQYIPLAGDVVMDNVDFGYTEEKLVLQGVNLYATPGQKIAFIGSTGAGKTTITNLINRFYDIQDGKIRYDGININRIKKDDLRRSLGMVLQDVHLFSASVLENIRYGRPDATDEECIAAAKLANADGFIRRLPEGYNTLLTGGGAGLSQGQRQLLAIARAAAADPPVLILDEATSSIDTRTEALVQQGMDGLMKGRTSFVIAHRLSTVRNADCIMVLEQGRIIERGTHDELLEKRGRYYTLFTGAQV